ncbi:MAG: FAD-dependent oxidoreductase [Bacillota bacterium]
MSKQPVRVLILGGGYVAISAARALRGAIRRGEAEVTVVSRENYHVFHGFISEMLTGRVQPGQILSPARRIFAPAKVHVGEIEAIDLQRQRVTTSRQLDGRRYELPYDYLLLCLGSVDNLEAYPGLAEHGFRLKTYDDCFRLRNHILTMFEQAEIESDPAERQRLLTFFVAGGGYAGTEVAGELADYIRLLTSREYRAVRREECRVVLVHPGETILPELYGREGSGHPRLVAYATRHLQRLGVEVLTGTRVAWSTPNEVGLSNGMRIPTRTLISAVGTRAAPILQSLPVEQDERGRVVVGRTLQVPGFPHVLAAGDCAAVPHPKGGTCPPVGIFALEQGKRASGNILRLMAGQEPRPFTFAGLGQAVSIGRRTAVAEAFGMEFKGLSSWLIWRLLLFSFIPTWDRRLRLLADWLIWPLVGRDIVEMSVSDADDYEISHHRFQPGEEIIGAGQFGRYLYLISEGEVEVWADGHLQSTLGPGGRFGHARRDRRVQESFRARGSVQAVSVRADQAHRLRAVLSSLGAAEGE